VLAMLHALAAEASPREVWWIHGARDRREHAFAAETRTLLTALAHGHSHVRYSSPDPEDRPGVDFDAPGRLEMRVLQELGVPRNGDFYIWTDRLHERFDRRPRNLGHRRKSHPHRDFRRGPIQYPGRRRVAAPAAALAGRPPQRGTVGLIRTGAVSMFAGGRRSRACSSLPKRATYLCDGRVEQGSATLVRPDLWSGRSATGPIRSMHRRPAMY
jgi:hypothetical protein